ncbi:hypothetical protein EG329_001300 [Mollisiaceae sp. DMI_Dod_QoI]|nr:hypothetical protein EG329_001300 [Helotiales sp. DMI_Dod_QoI]
MPVQLRGRRLGVGETFYPFKRLPTELRHMIWRITLEPRVVEVLEGDCREYQDKCVRKYENHYYTRAKLPIALAVSRDSRDALLPLYPLCFGSYSAGSQIRFNFSLDTLYIDEKMERYFFHFLERFTSKDLAKVEKLAIADRIGIESRHTYTWEEYEQSMVGMISMIGIQRPDPYQGYWETMGESINKLTELKEIFIVNDAMRYLDVKTLSSIENTDYQLMRQCNPKKRGIEIFEEFPKDLARVMGKSVESLMERFRDDHSTWNVKTYRHVWSLRTIKYDEPEKKGKRRWKKPTWQP